MGLSRRDWVFGSIGGAAWADVLAAAQHAHESAEARPTARLAVLDRATAADVEALAAQILPSGDGPGAREAGVIWFIDRALQTFDSDRRADYRDGMAEVRRVRVKLFPGSASVAALSDEQQKQLVRSIETTAFFGLLRQHTVLGFLGHPKYGGNRGQAGWKHIGFESRMAFEHPFGYYDARGRE